VINTDSQVRTALTFACKNSSRPRKSSPAMSRMLGFVCGLSVTLMVVDFVAAVVATRFVDLTRLRGVVAVAIVLSCQAGAGVYRRRLVLSFLHDVPRSIASVVSAFTLLILAMPLGGVPVVETIARALLYFAALTAVSRAAVFHLARQGRIRFGRCERAIIVGAGAVGCDLARLMLDHPEFGLRPVGFVDEDPRREDANLPVPLLGAALAAAIVEQDARVVVLAFSGTDDTNVVDMAIIAHQNGVRLFILPRMFELYPDTSHVKRLRSYPLVRLTIAQSARVSWLVKGVLDRLVAAVALVLTGPVMAVAALAVGLELGRPILFVQDRVGLDGRVFRLYKLRTMRPMTEQESETRWSIAGDPRIGPVGRVLRRTSIDELPQLWNVLRGDMSLVGARPERPGFVREFSMIHDRYWARHRVPAGMTGLAQVNGLRGDTSIADRTRYDNYYIASWSLWLDARIVLMTVRELLRRGRW